MSSKKLVTRTYLKIADQAFRQGAGPARSAVYTQ